MLLLIMVLYITIFPYLRTTKKSLTSLLLVASSTSWLRVCFESAMCLLRLGPKQTAIKHIAKRYPKSFSTNPISTRTFHQKTKLERSKIKIAECRINSENATSNVQCSLLSMLQCERTMCWNSLVLFILLPHLGPVIYHGFRVSIFPCPLSISSSVWISFENLNSFPIFFK